MFASEQTSQPGMSIMALQLNKLNNRFRNNYGNICYQLKAVQLGSLTVRPEPVEGWTVKPLMVLQAHHERLNLKLSR
jgi:hypothetical protein